MYQIPVNEFDNWAAGGTAGGGGARQVTKNGQGAGAPWPVLDASTPQGSRRMVASPAFGVWTGTQPPAAMVTGPDVASTPNSEVVTTR